MALRRMGSSLALGFAALSLLVAGVAQGAPAASAGSSAGSCTPAASRAGGIGGIQWAAGPGAGSICANPHATGGGIPPSPTHSGEPPLTWHGGPVVGGATPGELTVTPVYWVPTGFSVPAGYETLINQFIADAAAASGRTSNVFSDMTEYTNGGSTHLVYKLHAGTPITDTDAFPANGCTPDSGAIYSDSTGYSNCITNAQLLAEASTFTTAHSLPNSDLAHLYMYFLPKGMETCFDSNDGAEAGTCSLNSQPGFCGYHAFAAPPLVADMNYAAVDSPTGYTCSSDAGSNTGGNQSPNGNIDADTEISITSHETMETITDPEGTAWWDADGEEVADDCGYIYGDSTSFHGANGAKYNQTINAHHYFIQLEFSNRNFAVNPALSCIQQEAATITSASSATFRVGKTGSFKVTSTSPASTTVTKSGKLPAGVTFKDNHNGTATLSGKPAAKSGGKYKLVVTVKNGFSPAATQTFTLTVNQAPVFTSAASKSFKHGVKATFAVTAVGPPQPSKIKESGKLPSGVSFKSTDPGQGTLTVKTSKIGTFTFTFKASNSVGSTSQTFKLVIK